MRAILATLALALTTSITTQAEPLSPPSDTEAKQREIRLTYYDNAQLSVNVDAVLIHALVIEAARRDRFSNHLTGTITNEQVTLTPNADQYEKFETMSQLETALDGLKATIRVNYRLSNGEVCTGEIVHSHADLSVAAQTGQDGVFASTPKEYSVSCQLEGRTEARSVKFKFADFPEIKRPEVVDEETKAAAKN